MFSLCMSVHWRGSKGEGVPLPGPGPGWRKPHLPLTLSPWLGLGHGIPCPVPVPPLPGLGHGTTLPPFHLPSQDQDRVPPCPNPLVRIRTGYPSPGEEMTRTGYGAGGTSLAFSRRGTFLCAYSVHVYFVQGHKFNDNHSTLILQTLYL